MVQTAISRQAFIKDEYFVGLDGQGRVRISPTDVSQFIRLNQCERYLRLRLHERSAGLRFMYDYGVVPQSIPPLLTASGTRFEEGVERAVATRFPALNLADERTNSSSSPEDNERILELTRGLAGGETLVLFQPRLRVALGRWEVRGDIDILRLSRNAAGALQALIADIKSSTTAKVEHRLQVAFYSEMVSTLLSDADIVVDQINLGILYRGPSDGVAATVSDQARRELERAQARDLLGVEDGLLELVVDAEAYRSSVRDLVTGEDSTSARVTRASFAELPFHLAYKCDGCLYNEFCMKRCAETDDLSLLPHLTEQDKRALQRNGIATTSDLALLKDLRREGEISVDGEVQERTELVPAPERSLLARRLAATWPVGPRLDELIHRARRYRRWRKESIDALTYIPSKGYGSLPYSDATQNPNLIRIYIDAQHDYLLDRIYLLGALVVASEDGTERNERRRSVVRLSEGPPNDLATEERLFVDWIDATLRAMVELAAPDEEGRPRAPIHLIFYDGFAQRVLLDGLARHAGTILGATPLYDFVTQLAAFDSPVATFLEREIRDQKNYPMVCQSLQAVSAYLGFDWNAEVPYRDIFRTRLFDFWAKFDPPLDAAGERPGMDGWYTGRSRFNSQIPLEYAYAGWSELPAVPATERDDLAPYREATPDLLRGFHARRLEAMERVAKDFRGNKQTIKTAFDLPDLAVFEQKARTLAHALEEFVTIERHVVLADWKRERLAPPEQRVLAGQTLAVRYLEEDQAPGVAEKNRDNERRRLLNDAQRAAYREAHPDAKQVRLSKEEREQSEWSQEGMRFRLRLETSDLACDLDEALNLTTLKSGDWLVLCPRLTTDSRLPVAEQVFFTPTAKQMLYGMRVALERITVKREGERALEAWAEVAMLGKRSAGSGPKGFVFSTIEELPLVAGKTYTLDPNPNDYNGLHAAQVVEGLVAGGRNTFYALLAGEARPLPLWPEAGAAGQARFMAGLDALHAAGALHGFELSKREFIGGHGDAPLLLVQGPPGTGKSYSTGFALFARIQGAMSAGQDFRTFLSCKTHAATDVLLGNVADVRDRLREFSVSHPAIFADYFDPRLLDVPLYRVRPRGDVPGVIPLPKDDDRVPGAPRAVESIEASRWSVVTATPGGIFSLIKERWPKELFGHHLADCLVLDEASQMNLPEAVMAALPLAPDGRLIVVGDHRQMPPIIQHDWASEPRRTFQEFRSYESVFLALLPLAPPMIKFEESFRLHADMAEFLRREIYSQDGINYRSARRDVIETRPTGDTFVDAVLAPDHPLVVVVHDEAGSQVRNRFEQQLLSPVLEILADPAGYGLDPVEGLGVVVPHRAQRAALQEEVPSLTVIDPLTGAVTLSAVDTVERFQGGERTVILVGATESDREYLLASGEFLLDPRRLTVALSRAKRKMVLVAARSVFELFSADEETFANSQLWKNLLRRTCTVPLWAGERYGHQVEVWGNASEGTQGFESR